MSPGDNYTIKTEENREDNCQYLQNILLSECLFSFDPLNHIVGVDTVMILPSIFKQMMFYMSQLYKSEK